MQVAYGKQLPFPLSYYLPWSQQRSVRRKFEGVDIAQVGPSAHRSNAATVSASCMLACRSCLGGMNRYCRWCGWGLCFPAPTPQASSIPATSPSHMLVDQMYVEAAETLEALANHLTATSGSGNFFLGRQPTSLGERASVKGSLCPGAGQLVRSSLPGLGPGCVCLGLSCNHIPKCRACYMQGTIQLQLVASP